MNNGEVKRWQAPHMMRYRLPAERESETDHATEAYALPCSVVLASDHDRIVAQKDGELLTFYRMAASGVWIESKEYDELLKTIASQKRVIEKLIAEFKSADELLMGQVLTEALLRKSMWKVREAISEASQYEQVRNVSGAAIEKEGAK